jgi:hypothetical protein
MVHTSSYLGSLALVASAVVGKEIPVDETRAQELYDSGLVHQQIMDTKLVGSSESPPPISMACNG